jgi:hypothetical protein
VKGFFVWDLGALLEILIGFQPTKSIKKLTWNVIVQSKFFSFLEINSAPSICLYFEMKLFLHNELIVSKLEWKWEKNTKFKNKISFIKRNLIKNFVLGFLRQIYNRFRIGQAKAARIINQFTFWIREFYHELVGLTRLNHLF